MGSRVRVSAAACLVASGLLVGGVGTATAFADVGSTATDDASSPIRKPDIEDGADRNEKPVDEKPVDEKPVDEKPVDENPVDEKPVDEKPVDEKPVDEKPVDEVPVDEVPVDEKPVDEVPVDEKPVDEVPVDEVPVDEVPVDEVPVDGDPPVPGDNEPPRPSWPPSCDEGEQECGPWWPWPWPDPDPDPDPGDPPTSDRDGGGFPGGLPVGLPFPDPIIGIPPPPPIAEPLTPDVIDTVPGVGVAASGSPGAPLSVPVIVATPTGLGPGPGAVPSGAGTGPRLPAAPRQGPAEPPPARRPLPATAGSNIAVPASSHRVGYGEYLRTAGPSQIAALAVPGLAGILVLTGAGGFVGYRQAKAGRAVRTAGTARFVN